MARSAAQRARRRALRASRPVFPLTQLPPELQLNVLSKCDPLSFRLLLQVSERFRALYLSYPESCLRQVFDCLPASLLSLLHTSWALHVNEAADLDISIAIELFANGKVNGNDPYIAPIIVGDSDPLIVVDGLVDLYEEVHVATNLFAQSLNAAMESFINPWIVFKPIKLSSAEYARIASTLSVLRMFYILQMRCSAQEDVIPTGRAFLARLDPWEIDQLLALDEFLLRVGYERRSAVYRGLDAKYSDWKALSTGSTYVQRYFRALKFGSAQEESSSITPASITQALGSVLQGRLRHPPPDPSLWYRTIDEALSRMMVEDAASCCPSRTFGWLLYESMVRTRRLPQWDSRLCFGHLGMLFWDYDRLNRWGIIDQPTFNSMFSQLENHLQEASRYVYRSTLNLRPGAHYSEKQKAEIITRWTRSPIACSIEEWLWQHDALDRYSRLSPATGSFDGNIQYNMAMERSCFNPHGCKSHGPY
jgi:hypothetical protein